MTDLTPDEILEGLRVLLTRAETDAATMDDPMPLERHGPPAPVAAPRVPPVFDRPGHVAYRRVANSAGVPRDVRFKGL